METSDIISLVSLSISVLAGIYSWITRRKLNKQQLQINDYTLLKNKKDEEEEKKLKYVLMLLKRERRDGEYVYSITEKGLRVI